MSSAAYQCATIRCFSYGINLLTSIWGLFFSCDQAAFRTLLSVCPSVRLSVCLSVCLSDFCTFLYNVSVIVLSWNFQELLPMTEVMSMQKVKVRCQRSRSQRSKTHLTVSGPQLHFELTYGDEMMHNAWCWLGEVPYCLSRSYVKFRGHTAKKIIDIDPRLRRT